MTQTSPWTSAAVADRSTDKSLRVEKGEGWRGRDGWMDGWVEERCGHKDGRTNLHFNLGQ